MVYNHFNRWSRRRFWKAMLSPEAGWIGEAAAIDATYDKAHRSAQGGIRGDGAGHRPLPGTKAPEPPRQASLNRAPRPRADTQRPAGRHPTTLYGRLWRPFCPT